MAEASAAASAQENRLDDRVAAPPLTGGSHAGRGAHVRGVLQRRHAVRPQRVARLRQGEEAGAQRLAQLLLRGHVTLQVKGGGRGRGRLAAAGGGGGGRGALIGTTAWPLRPLRFDHSAS